MDTPLYTNHDDIAVYPKFVRISTPFVGVCTEFGLAHVVKSAMPGVKAWERGKRPKADEIPDGSVCLDRYGDMRAGKQTLTPLRILNTPKNKRLIAAILYMKRADVSHMQLDDNGCGPAVVAHLTGLSYAEVVRKLYPSGNVRILGTQRLADATRTMRHICKAHTWDEVERGRGCAALIKNTDPRLGSHYGHFVSIDPGMVIVDPELVMRYPLAEYPRKTWTPMMYFVRT